MASTPARDPAKSSMDPASANKEGLRREGQHGGRTVARFLRGLARQKEAANDGSSHLLRKFAMILLIVGKKGVNFGAIPVPRTQSSEWPGHGDQGRFK
jgi:hypothetical protein